MINEREALSVKETAIALRISRVTVFRLLKEGRLKRLKIGRRTVIPCTEITRLLKEAA